VTPTLRFIGRSLETLAGPLPRLTGALVERLWHTPYPSGRRTDPHHAHREWYPVPEGRIHAWRWGQGPTVLLLHGWGSSAARFAPLAEAIATTGHSALAIDLPGHGRSYGRRTNVFKVADAAQRVAEQQEGPLVGLLGHLFGGFAALFLSAAGIGVPRVVSVSAPAEMEDVIGIFRQQIEAGPRSESLLRERIALRYGPDIADQLHLPTLLAKYPDPVLLVHDRDDADVPCETSQRLAVTIPRAQLMLTEGLGHHRLIRDPAVIQRTVGFLTD
jgi:pimeloyl-ACP methyl ester carboxylesterase